MLNRHEKKIVFTIIIIMALLSFANLGNRYMFIDESITAQLGRNVLKFGYPRVWDGKNLITAAVNGNEFNERLVYIKHNWLPYYMAALGQLLGDTVFVMRAIFVLTGIAGALTYYRLAKKITENNKTALLSLILFAFSVPVLLYIRSIYYLSPGLTFTILTILFYIEFIDKGKISYLAIFVLSATMLFHSLFVFFFVTMITLISAYVLFDRKYVREFVTGLIGIAALTLPWFIYSNQYLTKVQTGLFLGKIYFWDYLLGYLWMIHAYFVPFLPLGIIFLCYKLLTRADYRKRQKTRAYLDDIPLWLDLKSLIAVKQQPKGCSKRNIYIVIMQIVSNLLILSLFGNYLNTRWLIPAIPFLFILAALVLHSISKYDRFIAITIFVLMIFTNGLHISPYLTLKILPFPAEKAELVIKPPVPFFNVDSGWETKVTDLAGYLESDTYVRSYLLDYIGGISNDYDDAEEGMVQFLKKYGKPGNRVHLVGFQHETIIYYTDMTLVNRLDPKRQYLPLSYSHYPNAERFEHLTAYPIEACDWVVIREYDNKNELIRTKETIKEYGYFEEFYIDYPEGDPWCEIWAHSFQTNHDRKGFFIYRNMKTTDAVDIDWLVDKEVLEDGIQ